MLSTPISIDFSAKGIQATKNAVKDLAQSLNKEMGSVIDGKNIVFAQRALFKHNIERQQIDMFGRSSDEILKAIGENSEAMKAVSDFTKSLGGTGRIFRSLTSPIGAIGMAAEIAMKVTQKAIQDLTEAGKKLEETGLYKKGQGTSLNLMWNALTGDTAGMNTFGEQQEFNRVKGRENAQKSALAQFDGTSILAEFERKKQLAVSEAKSQKETLELTQEAIKWRERELIVSSARKGLISESAKIQADYAILNDASYQKEMRRLAKSRQIFDVNKEIQDVEYQIADFRDTYIKDQRKKLSDAQEILKIQEEIYNDNLPENPQLVALRKARDEQKLIKGLDAELAALKYPPEKSAEVQKLEAQIADAKAQQELPKVIEGLKKTYENEVLAGFQMLGDSGKKMADELIAQSQRDELTAQMMSANDEEVKQLYQKRIDMHDAIQSLKVKEEEAPTIETPESRYGQNANLTLSDALRAKAEQENIKRRMEQEKQIEQARAQREVETQVIMQQLIVAFNAYRAATTGNSTPRHLGARA